MINYTLLLLIDSVTVNDEQTKVLTNEEKQEDKSQRAECKGKGMCMLLIITCKDKNRSQRYIHTCTSYIHGMYTKVSKKNKII